MLRIRKVSEVMGMKVYTDSGDYLGEIEDANISENKVDGWKIRVSRESTFTAFLGGAKGLVVPHQFIKAMGAVAIVSKSVMPEKAEEETTETTIAETA